MDIVIKWNTGGGHLSTQCFPTSRQHYYGKKYWICLVVEKDFFSITTSLFI